MNLIEAFRESMDDDKSSRSEWSDVVNDLYNNQISPKEQALLNTVFVAISGKDIYDLRDMCK